MRRKGKKRKEKIEKRMRRKGKREKGKFKRFCPN